MRAIRSSTWQCSNSGGTSLAPSGETTVGTMTGPSALRLGGGACAWVGTGFGSVGGAEPEGSIRASDGRSGGSGGGVATYGCLEGPGTAFALVGSRGVVDMGDERSKRDQARVGPGRVVVPVLIDRERAGESVRSR